MNHKPLTVPMLAERWSCSRDFVYEQIKNGKLQATRLGGKLLRVSVAEVERWESLGANINSDLTGSDNSTGRPSSHGGTPLDPTGSGSASKAKLKADLRLMRLSENGNS